MPSERRLLEIFVAIVESELGQRLGEYAESPSNRSMALVGRALVGSLMTHISICLLRQPSRGAPMRKEKSGGSVIIVGKQQRMQPAKISFKVLKEIIDEFGDEFFQAYIDSYVRDAHVRQSFDELFAQRRRLNPPLSFTASFFNVEQRALEKYTRSYRNDLGQSLLEVCEHLRLFGRYSQGVKESEYEQPLEELSTRDRAHVPVTASGAMVNALSAEELPTEELAQSPAIASDVVAEEPPVEEVPTEELAQLPAPVSEAIAQEQALVTQDVALMTCRAWIKRDIVPAFVEQARPGTISA